MGVLIYKWEPSFINEDIYLNVGTNGTPYVQAIYSIQWRAPTLCISLCQSEGYISQGYTQQYELESVLMQLQLLHACSFEIGLLTVSPLAYHILYLIEGLAIAFLRLSHYCPTIRSVDITQHRQQPCRKLYVENTIMLVQLATRQRNYQTVS